jgi:hypothetical protein
MKSVPFFLALILWFPVSSQKQLILTKGEKVVARFTEGEYFRCKLKNKQKKEGRIVELNDLQMITSNDTLSITSIESIRLKSKRISFAQKVGQVLMISGIGYITLDRLNSLIMKGKQPLDKSVVVTSTALTASGAALVFIHSPYKKVYGHTLKTIDYTSRFYRLP